MRPTHCMVPMCPNFDGRLEPIVKVSAINHLSSIFCELNRQNDLFKECFLQLSQIPPFFGICSLHFDDKDLLNHPRFNLIIAKQGFPRKLLGVYELFLYKIKHNLNKRRNEHCHCRNSTTYEYARKQVISEFHSILSCYQRYVRTQCQKPSAELFIATPLIAYEPTAEQIVPPIQASSANLFVTSPPIADEATDSVLIDPSTTDIPESASMQVLSPPSQFSLHAFEITVPNTQTSTQLPIIAFDNSNDQFVNVNNSEEPIETDVESEICLTEYVKPNELIKMSQLQKQTITEVSDQQIVTEMPLLTREAIPFLSPVFVPTPSWPIVVNQPKEPMVELEPGEIEPGDYNSDSESAEELYGHRILPQKQFKAGTVIEISDDEDYKVRVNTNEVIEID